MDCCIIEHHFRNEDIILHCGIQLTSIFLVLDVSFRIYIVQISFATIYEALALLPGTSNQTNLSGPGSKETKSSLTDCKDCKCRNLADLEGKSISMALCYWHHNYVYLMLFNILFVNGLMYPRLALHSRCSQRWRLSSYLPASARDCCCANTSGWCRVGIEPGVLSLQGKHSTH